MGGSVGRWPSDQWSVDRFSVGRWPVDLIKPIFERMQIYVIVRVRTQ